MQRFLIRCLAAVPGLGVALLPVVVFAADTGAVAPQYRILTFLVFGAIIGLTLYITFWAAKYTHSTAEFYAAGRTVSGLQNGWAIAGDYLSAASFLGIAGLVSLNGYDGFMYSVGFLVAFITVLLVIAEPCRNIGKYTLGDILAFRNNRRTAKTVAAFSTITVSTFYLIAQMVGGGVLVKTLIGIDYEVSVVVVGVLMLSYVVFGGMKATTWVQIVKAALLVLASTLLVFFVWAPYGFSMPAFLTAVVSDEKVIGRVAKLLGDSASNMTPAQLGQRFLEPGLLLKDPLDQLSLGMALVLGTAGLPHILMRFFTVPTAQAARKSVIWAMIIIGGFYVLTLFLGLGAAINVGAAKISAFDKGGNMAAPLLAQFVGGGADSILGNLFLAFVAAVAFATIVAVVAGLVLASASAMAHDIYVGVIRGDHATPEEQVRAARISALIVGVVSIGLGIMAKGQNVAHLVGLAFAVAASSNLPAVVMTLYWKRCNTGGVVLGMVVGAVTAIGLVMVSPNMTYPLEKIAAANNVLQEDQALLTTALAPARQAEMSKNIEKLSKEISAAQDELKKYEGQTTSLVGLQAPIFMMKNPGIVSIPAGFLCVIIGSLLFRDKRAEEMWDELYVRQNTGLQAESSASH
ncbi:MAG: cation acetate symporter [Deltaproteobacteria bacterium CG23_combo_of_CG06-09_8_20_14_all_60_8]|nr:MAG: cation acetate symporter [Desulfobacterales bacterium CG2_30_60_27]PIP43722.1 MAG: cation acetate symporter [Deltaproteobacteria bacterium CG23_combo_of_CG06-09_8_20_14_all_60_8]